MTALLLPLLAAVSLAAAPELTVRWEVDAGG